MSIGSRLAGQRACGAVMAASVTLGCPRGAHAETPLEPVELSYLAPESCPSRAEFLAEIQRSTARIRLAEAGTAARHFEITIEPTGQTGRFSIDGGSQGVRAVRGGDCAEVSRLLAFATALAADPDARATETSSAVAAFPMMTEANDVPPGAPQTPPAATADAKPATIFPASVPSVRPAQRLVWSAAGFGFAKSASAPGLTLGAGAFGEVVLTQVTLRPTFRLGLGYSAKDVTQDQGRIELATEFLTLEACSASLRRRNLTFLPCVRGQGGRRVAAGHDLPHSRSEGRPFLELGIAGHLRWRLVSSLFLELAGAMLFPVIRDQVLILPSDTVYQVPRVGGLGELALGFEFGDQNRK